MSNSTKPVSKRRFNRSEEHMRKVHVYKDTALNAMQDASQFDTTIVESNDGYMEKLREADSTEYEILKMNMEKAETAEEREAIRKRMAEMDKERYAKDTENKAFYEKQQEAHRNHNLKILGSVAIVSGLVYYILENQTKYNQCESEVQISLMDLILDETPEILLSYYNKDNIPCLDVISCVSKDSCSIEITIMGLKFSDIRFLASIDERTNQYDSYLIKTSYTVDNITYTDWDCIYPIAFYSGLICRKIVNDDGTVEWESYCKGEKTEESAEEIEYDLSDTSYGYAKSEKDNIIAEPFYTSDSILIQDINSEAFIDQLIASMLNLTKKGR